MLSPAKDPATTVHRSLWMLVGLAAVLIFVPPLTRRGMTWDGVLYATIARNIAVGIGDVWHPRVSGTFMRHFHEHPPLAFWLESLLFRVLGDHFWVERVYSLGTGLITAAILVALWRHIMRDVPTAAAMSWLPILLWMSYSQWSYRHNILENTLGIFTALAVYAVLRALDSPRAAIGWSLVAGGAIAAALLSKGPVGLFPAVSPIIAAVALRRASWRRAALVQGLVLAAAGGALGCVLANADAREYLQGYLQGQVLASVSGQREAIKFFPGRLTILLFLARDIMVPGGLAALIYGAARLGGRPAWDSRLSAPARFCLLTGLSASLPLMACPKQHGHYTAPSWPFFCCALALACCPAVQSLLPLVDRLSSPRRARITGCLLAAGLVFACGRAVIFYGVPYARDRQIIDASDTLARAIGAHATVAADPAAWNRLASHERLRLHAYLYRDHFISLWSTEDRGARILPHLRLEAPAVVLPVAYEPIVIYRGLECQRLPGLASADDGTRRR